MMENSTVNEKTGRARLMVSKVRRNYVRDYIQRTVLLGMRQYRKWEVDKLPISEEAEYVANAAKRQIVVNRAEHNLLSIGALRREFLKHKLHMNDNGDFIGFSGQWLYVWVTSWGRGPRRKLEKAIEKSRHLSEEILATLSLMNDDSDKNLYLCEHFIVGNLPPILRHFASKHFFGRFSGLNGDSLSNRFWTMFALVFVPLYCIGVLLYIFLFGVTYGPASTNTWLVNVAINIGMDIFIQQPMKIFVLDIIVTGVFIKQVHSLHTHLKARYYLILSRKEGLVTPGVDIVQHFNAACRAARYHTSASMSKVLLSINDFDMPLLLPHETRHTYVETLTHLFFVMTLLVLVLVTTVIPEVMEDVVMETLVALTAPVAFMGLFYVGRIALPLPFIIVFVVLLVVAAREIVIIRRKASDTARELSLSIEPRLLLKSVPEGRVGKFQMLRSLSKRKFSIYATSDEPTAFRAEKKPSVIAALIEKKKRRYRQNRESKKLVLAGKSEKTSQRKTSPHFVVTNKPNSTR